MGWARVAFSSLAALHGVAAFSTPFGYCGSALFEHLLRGAAGLMEASQRLGHLEFADSAKPLVNGPAATGSHRSALLQELFSVCKPARALQQLLDAAYLGRQSEAKAVVAWLAEVWWSEVLSESWIVVVLGLLELVSEEAGPGVPPATSAALTEIEVELRSQEPSNATSPFLYFARRIDAIQRAWFFSAATPTLPVAELRGVAEALSDVGLIGRWWYKSSRIVVSMHCGGLESCASSCLPLLWQAFQSPLVSRHSIRLSTDSPECRDLTQRWSESIGVEIDLVFEHPDALVKSAGSEVAALRAHVSALDDLITANRRVDLVLMLDIGSSEGDAESALSQIWDMDRWLLHRRVEG
eukprot:CAMPEP_0176033802 /NCGR_PEP_ID=MMETSP0120_2-20121206/16698_1 /TAXON_ID=160619 /ORGANISM="Kryptoperidinium foliaceum, Strain CCMP 1326" /LENGTH=353 /DNA_ID=CAMNT_0017367129 /DNA_START=1 /DNA_END=1058 /DNA_ORIENTATION=-